MEYGIIIGVGISTGAILFRLLQPKLNESVRTDEATGTKYIIVTPEAGLLFPSVDYVRTTLGKLALKYKSIEHYFLNFEKWTEADYTAATALAPLTIGFKKIRKLSTSSTFQEFGLKL